jgi:exodeoxyribonuclease VII large subunit
VLRRLQNFASRMHREVAECVQRQRRRLDFLSRGALMREPRHQLESAAQRLDGAGESLHRAVKEWLARERRKLVEHAAVLRHQRPDHLLALRRQQVATLRRALTERARQALATRLRELHRIREMLRVLSPEATLERGYSITTDEAGKLIDRVSAVESGMRLQTRLQDGSVRSTAQ